MEKIKNAEKQKEFAKLFLTGKYTQLEIAGKVGVSTRTASLWAKQIHPVRYFNIRKDLTKQLEQLIKKSNYTSNADMISKLITDIERIEKLIIKAKYIPHLTNN